MKKLIALVLGAALLTANQPARATISCSLPFQLQNNTTADATQVMANYNALVTCFTAAASAGVNADITALTALSTPLTPAQGGTPVYIGGTSTGINTVVVTISAPTGFTLATGKRLTFLAGFTNTGATTLNVNSLGAANVFRMTPSGAQALTGGEIVAGNITEVLFDGTQFQLLSTQAQFGGLSVPTNVASATTTDVGTVASHFAVITGTTTITSLGSSASTTYPVYLLFFTGTLTLTHNASSLILPGSANITTAASDIALGVYIGSGNWRIASYTRSSGKPLVPTGIAPTYQIFDSGTSQTYTTAAGATWLRIRQVAGGGGSQSGGTGGTTTFNSISVTGGATGVGSAAGAGGTGGSGTATLRIPGSPGSAGQSVAGSDVSAGLGGLGGRAAFFAIGPGWGPAGGAAQAGIANTGSGASGAGGSGGGNSGNGGGGAGEYAETVIGSPAATYTYSVGAGGTAGAGGAAGGSGRIIVEEYYN